MDSTNVMCPVCTLYLRPGITLKTHLTSHPKQKVIEALVRLSENGDKIETSSFCSQSEIASTSTTVSWNQGNNVVMPQLQGTNVFIYQHSMTSSPQQNQNYIIPTILNSQMMPYIYQQQVFMSGSCLSPMKTLPYESKIDEIEEIDDDKEQEQSELDDELNKACQTQTSNQQEEIENYEDEEREQHVDEVEEEEEEENGKGNFYFENEENFETNPIYPNILQSEQLFDVDGMQVVINEVGDFSTNQIISQVENFEGNGPDAPGVLMTIGGMMDQKEDFLEHRDVDESTSRESSNVNIIRADERMPPRGELSGQESISSDVTWNRIQYESSGTSYDLMANNNWEASDSEIDVPPLQSRNPQFSCTHCEEVFTSLKEKEDHENEQHQEKTLPKINRIGTDIGKSKVRKIIVKFKEKQEDFVFTNKIKIENEAQVEIKSENDTTKEEPKTVCPICNSVVANAKALREHKMTAHNLTSQTRHKCSTCGEEFPNDYKFSEHLRIHPLECKICGRLFYRRQNIQLHMRRHLGIKPYKCDVCGKSFLTKQKLDEHRNIHTGDAPIKCPLCDETFRRHSNLVQHRNRHHLNIKKKVKDYICFCKEVFHSKKKLAWHKEIHDAKPKSCAHCNEKFIHMSSLTRHMRRAHNHRFLPNGHKNAENVECPICKGVYLKSSLEVHIRNHSGQRPYTCLICNKDFTTKWNLKLHKWTHASRVSKPFKCDQCKGAFIRESDYVAHMNSHKSIRPYTCNYCGAQFIRKYNCQRHVKEHENEKMFTCKVCGKSFHRSYYLKDHMRIHSGLRPYSCHICGKTSTTKSNHNKHVQIHHAREPVSTEN